MNDIIQVLLTRRSIRSFRADMPKKEDIDCILEAGLYAPSGKNRQGVISIAVTNKDMQAKLREDNRKIGGWDEGFDPFFGAPVIIIVLAEKDWRLKTYDGSLVMGNMMLAAHALGLGSVWINRAKEEFDMPEYQKWLKELGIEGEWEGIGHVALGYIQGDHPKAAPRKPNRVYYVD